MRLSKFEGDRYEFGISPAERTVLLALLNKYPVIPLSHYRLSRESSDTQSAEQSLLEEAMVARRTQFKRRVRQLIEQSDRFRPARNRLVVAFTREEIEWLLQVLNDVRVGNWIRIGCPDPDQGARPPKTQEGKLALAEMEIAAHFECQFLEAVDGPPA